MKIKRQIERAKIDLMLEINITKNATKVGSQKKPKAKKLLTENAVVAGEN